MATLASFDFVDVGGKEARAKRWHRSRTAESMGRHWYGGLEHSGNIFRKGPRATESVGRHFSIGSRMPSDPHRRLGVDDACTGLGTRHSFPTASQPFVDSSLREFANGYEPN